MQIPGYKIKGLLAHGGMSQVFLAEQESLQRQVVLKVLDPGVDPTVQERFLHEGRLIASLDHRNIITIYDVGSVDGHHYLAMEYLQGGDFAQRIVQGIRPQQSLKIIQAIAMSLQYVHNQGIVHGDIKPSNILFRKDGTPILTDFGIAKRDGDQRVDDGLFVSPFYVSPEQAQGHPYDGRSDIYSLGIVLYEALVGAKPFTGKDEVDTIAKAINEAMPALPPVYSELQSVLEKMAAKQPHHRYQSAKEVADELYKLRKNTDLPLNRIALDKTIPLDGEALQAALASSEAMQKNKNVSSKSQSEQDKASRSSWLGRTLSLIILLAIGGAWLYQEQAKQWLWFVADTPKSSNTDAPIVLPPGPEQIKSDAAPVEAASQDETELSLAQAQEKKKQVEEALRLQQEALERVRLEQERLEAEAVAKAKREAAAKAERERQAKIAAAKKREQERQRQIRSYLSKADQKLAEYKLTTPLNDNALYYYQQVFSLDPENERASKGIDGIAQRYEWLARKEIDKYEYKKARYYIDLGLTVRPDHEGLLALRDEATILKEPKRVVDKIERFFKGF